MRALADCLRRRAQCGLARDAVNVADQLRQVGRVSQCRRGRRAQQAGQLLCLQIVAQADETRLLTYFAHEAGVDLFIDPRLDHRGGRQQHHEMRAAFDSLFDLAPNTGTAVIAQPSHQVSMPAACKARAMCSAR